jgi:hypothetical protein
MAWAFLVYAGFKVQKGFIARGAVAEPLVVVKSSDLFKGGSPVLRVPGQDA